MSARVLKLSVVVLSPLFLFGVADTAFADTDVSGDLTTDTMWADDTTPYVIGDGHKVTVPYNVTLTVGAGVVVKFGRGASITGDGRLIVAGTEEKPVTFTSVDPALRGGDGNLGSAGWSVSFGSWMGGNPGPHQIKNLSVSNSGGGLYFGHGAVTVENLSISDSDNGLIVWGSPTSIEHVRMKHVANGFSASVSTVTIFDADFDGSGSGTAPFSFLSSPLTMSSTTVRNVAGPALSLNVSSAVITGSTFLQGTGDGIYLTTSSLSEQPTLTISSSTIAGFARNGINAWGGVLKITGSKIQDNATGISLNGGLLTIRNSAIERNSRDGIANTGNVAADALFNWWGDMNGPRASDNPSGTGNSLWGNVDFFPWISSDPFSGGITKPVIIIPGILGSAEKNGVWLIDPILHVYDNLIGTLKVNGYVEGTNLFTFPYNWRNSNVETAVLLKQKIDEVKQICRCEKVDIVAHSMGGLVARQYIEFGGYSNDIDHLIFLGTPHLGAPTDYLAWEAGKSAKDRYSQLINFLLSREARKNHYVSLFDYIQNKPIHSVEELLPVFDYLRDSGNIALKHYPEGSPRNIFLENLKDNVSNLYNSGVKISNIVGNTGMQTVGVIRVVPSLSLPLWANGYPEGFDNKDSVDYGLELTEGDGTVPVNSSNLGGTPNHSLPSAHINLPEDTEDVTYKILTGKNPQDTIHSFHIPGFVLIIKMLSPADMIVTAPDGKKIGKDFVSDGEVNQIEGAFYSGFDGDDEYITIPDPMDGEYVVKTQGTGTGGEYTVSSAFIGDNVGVEKDLVAYTTPGMIESIDIRINKNNPDKIEVVPQDSTPPVITISSPAPRDYVRGDKISVEVSASDADTGVLSVELSLDDKMLANRTAIDSSRMFLGTHTFIATSSDYVGNVSSGDVLLRIVATYDSLIADIHRAFNLGWIDKYGIEQSLIAKVSASGGGPLLNALLNELNAQRGKHVDEKAYQLLVEDIYWLLNH